MDKIFYVYIATNQRNTVFYTGITNNLQGRMFQHRGKVIKGFTSRYNINKLVYYETFNTPMEAITAEKRIKGWIRKKKIDLIKSQNPKFSDLSEIERDPSCLPAGRHFVQDD